MFSFYTEENTETGASHTFQAFQDPIYDVSFLSKLMKGNTHACSTLPSQQNK
jgi:hypothetical protein